MKKIVSLSSAGFAWIVVKGNIDHLVFFVLLQEIH